MKKYKLYIFDLDGVILNSKSNMEASWKDVRAKHAKKLAKCGGSGGGGEVCVTSIVSNDGRQAL